MADVLALFPLSHVLLPGMPLPLHIFEQRYRDLMDDIEHAPEGQRFGVVALRSGTEVDSVQPRHSAPDVAGIGTVAEVLEWERRDDGTSDVLAVGSSRFRIERLLPGDRPYLRAEVTYLAESDGALQGDEVARARQLMQAYDALLLRLAGRTTGGTSPADATQLSYQIAGRLPLTPSDRQELLGDGTTAERLVRLIRLLRREIALLRSTRSIAVSPSVVRIGSTSN